MSRRGRITIAVLIGVFLFFTLLGWLVDAWTDYLWFDEVQYTEVFSSVLRTRLMLFAIFGAGMALIVGGNLYLAYRLRPLLRPHSPEQATLERYRMVLAPRIGTWIGVLAALIGFFAGLSAQGRWSEWLLFRNGGPFGVEDPQYNIDIGFYVFDYPFWRYLLGFGFTAVVLSVVGSIAMHYIFGGVRLQGAGDRMTTAARAHLTSLVAVFVLLKAVAYVLDKRALLLDYNDKVSVYGAGYTAVNALVPAKEILSYISIVVAIAIIVFSNAMMRNLLWPGVSLALLAVSAIAIGGIYPWSVQTFSVNPSLRDKEAPYIQRSIEATRAAFGLANAEVTRYPATTAVPPASLTTDTSIVPNIRLLDPAVVSDTYTQLEQVRGFYRFGEKLDIDRYSVNDRTQDYVVGLREIEYSDLTEAQSNWQNRHTVFTHGYGLVAAPANRTVCSGQPLFVSGFLGESDADAGPGGGEACKAPAEQISVEQPRIYYGERMGAGRNDYAIVGKGPGGRDVEFDRPVGSSEQYYTYQGSGGVELGSMWRKMLYAMKYREGNFVLSDAVNDNSRLMYIRDPRDRVQKVAPFLTLDGDPYPAVVEGKVVWIVDGYTTASTYPYSQRINLQQATNDSLTDLTVRQARQNINYIRNSVKATVDAYDGTVTLYEFDGSDPILRAWNKAFGGELVKPSSEISPDLMQHFRYPVDMFKVQRNLLAQFHVTNPGEFFSGQDFWEVPDDPTGGSAKQPPYYLLTQLPGQEETRFQLTATMTPRGRQNLAALVSGSYVDGKPQLQVLELPDETAIPGPGQVQQKMKSLPEVTTDLNLFDGQNTRVEYGNLLSLPFGGGMLYVEPLYIQTSGENTYPLMRKVLLNYGEYVAYADDLPSGIRQLVEAGKRPPPTTEPGDTSPTPPPTQSPTPTPPPSPTPSASPSVGAPPDLSAAAAQVQEAIRAVRSAQASGDFEAYGRALAQLDQAMKNFEAAQARANPGTPGSPGPTPDG
jgi:uncharacterized membrane protein (UPF0182 family)